MTGSDTAAHAEDFRTSDVLISVVLDKSGSMQRVREATISGFNEFKNDQHDQDGRTSLTLTMFDTEVHHACVGSDVAEVPDLDGRSYRPSGCTALFDAVGLTIERIDSQLAEMDSGSQRVIVVVMTDGLENASRQFDRSRVFEMIRNRESEQNWEFVFMGANQDSYASAEQIGMRRDHAVDYAHSREGAQTAFRRIANNVRSYRDKELDFALEHQWFSDDEEMSGERLRELKRAEAQAVGEDPGPARRVPGVPGSRSSGSRAK